jgi:chromosome segregation ATPase
MSLRGSPVDWWREKRQSSHSGIPAALRPATAFPRTGDRDVQKIVEEAVLAAFESEAFKIAIASHVDPTFARQQEKLNQIRATNLNLESILQAHVEDLPVALKDIQDNLAGLEIPEYGQELGALSNAHQGLQSRLDEIHIPNYEHDLRDISSSQERVLKALDSRFSSLETRMDELHRKMEGLDESVVNADLRSAIRFGELSNELQDRNTILGDRVWGVERDLGKKIDGLQRKMVGVYEELERTVRGAQESIEEIQANIEENGKEVKKTATKAEAAEKARERSITAIHQKITDIETLAIPLQVSKLDVLDQGVSQIIKELQDSRQVMSMDSKLLSDNTSKLDIVISAVGSIHDIADSTKEITQNVMASQKSNLSSAQNLIEAVHIDVRGLSAAAASHSEHLHQATSEVTRIDTALTGLDAAILGKLYNLESGIQSVKQELSPLPSHTTRLDSLQSMVEEAREDMKPHKEILDDLKTTLLEMTTNIGTALSSHDDSLHKIQQKVDDSSLLHQLLSSLEVMQTSIDHNISVSLSSVQKDSSRLLTEVIEGKKITHGDHNRIVENLKTIEQSNNSMKEEILTLQTTTLQTVQMNSTLIDKVMGFKPVQVLSAKVDDLAASILSGISKGSEDLHLLSKSTAEDIVTQIQNVDGKLRTEFELMTEAAESRTESLNSPLSNILKEIQASTTSMEVGRVRIYEELRQTKSSIEASRAAHSQDSNAIISILHDGQNSRKDDEVLSQIATWGERHTSKQAANMSILVGLFDVAQQNDQEFRRLVADLGEKSSSMFKFLQSGNLKSSSSLQGLDSIKRLLGEDETLLSIKEIATDATQMLNEVQVDVQKIRNNSTMVAMKDLLNQIASSLTTAHGDVIAIDTKIKTSENVVCSAIQNTVEKSLLGTVSSMTTSMDNAIGDLKLDLESRVSTVINALNTEVTRIDSTAALGALRQDVQSYSTALDHKTTITADDIKTSMLSSLDTLTAAVKSLSNDHNVTSQQNSVTLSRLEEAATTTSTSLSHQLLGIRENLDVVGENTEGIGLIIAGVQKLDQATQDNVENMHLISGAISKVEGQVDKVTKEIQTCSAEISQGIQANHSILSEMHQVNSETLPRLQADIKNVDRILANVVNESEEARESILSSITNTSAKVLSQIQLAKEVLDDDLDAVQSSIDNITKAVNGTSADIHGALDKRASEALTGNNLILTTIKSETKALSDTLLRGTENSTTALDAGKELMLQEVQSLKKALILDFTMSQKSLEMSLGCVSNDLGAKLADFAVENRDARHAHDSQVTALKNSIHEEAQISHTALESLRSGVASEAESTRLSINSLLSSIRMDCEGLSNNINTSSISIRDGIKELDIQTVKGFSSVKASVEQTKITIDDTIQETRTSLNNISGGMKAIDAAVRVNSAAIARVDKAVLETGSQVKAVVLDGNREVLSQLDEELHESGTRIRGISEFDIPRLEAIGKKNGDILEVIGARVIGTTKKFDEMVAHHSQHSQKSQKSLEHSEVLNRRLRGGSNASSSKDSGPKKSTT